MKGSNNGAVQYRIPLAANQASNRPRAGRRCEAIGCVTLLSTYNSSTTCWLHSAAVRRLPLESASS